MEIQPRPPMVGKKLWNMVRAVYYMIKAGILKSKIMVDAHLMLKRGKLAGKAISNLMFHHHYSSFSCRSNDARLSFISPKEYEFSCSNSPANFNPFSTHKRKHHHHFSKSYNYDDVTTGQAVQKVLEMLKNNNTVEASPLVTLPGFGKSPMVRQLRITDSPFPLKEEAGDSQVDKAAEEFIKKFYKDLKLQTIDSPFHHSWGR